MDKTKLAGSGVKRKSEDIDNASKTDGKRLPPVTFAIFAYLLLYVAFFSVLRTVQKTWWNAVQKCKPTYST